jgi:hypothetical protein
MSQTKISVDADNLHDKMEDAIRKPAGNGMVDCLVHFARMVTGEYLPGDVEDIIDNDLDDCTPEYAEQYRKTWNMLNRELTAIIES